jgi:hypothetical protein
MPKFLQGDVFATARNHAGLAVVFGYIGFNRFNLAWRAFAKTIPSLQSTHDPFAIANQPIEYEPGRWAWFVRYSPENNGLSDGEMRSALDRALSWAHGRGLTSITTNGVADTIAARSPLSREQSDARRARLLADLAAEYERRLGVSITLVSLDDQFVKML